MNGRLYHLNGFLLHPRWAATILVLISISTCFGLLGNDASEAIRLLYPIAVFVSLVVVWAPTVRWDAFFTGSVAVALLALILIIYPKAQEFANTFEVSPQRPIAHQMIEYAMDICAGLALVIISAIAHRQSRRRYQIAGFEYYRIRQRPTSGSRMPTRTFKLTSPHPRFVAMLVLTPLSWALGIVVASTVLWAWPQLGHAVPGINAYLIYLVACLGWLLSALGIWSTTIRWTSKRRRAANVVCLACIVTAAAIGTPYLFAGARSSSFGMAMLVLPPLALFMISLICWDPPCISTTVRCPKCRYDLRGQRECRCPECGVEFTLGELVGSGMALNASTHLDL